MKNPYAVLGVKRTASEAEIKSAYRKLAKELHPDRNADNPKAAERFKDVAAAYDILGDAEKKARFDRGEINAQGQAQQSGFDFHDFARGRAGRASGGQTGGFQWSGNAEDLFADLFSGRGGRRGGAGFEEQAGRPGAGRGPRGTDIEYELPVDFVDAALGKPQRLTLVSGKTLEIKLPAGVSDGQQIRLGGQGMTGPGGAGDALVSVTIRPHPYYRREGDTILVDLPVALDEAVLGAKVKAPTVDGPVLVTVPAGSTSGKQLRLKGKGFSRKDGGRGDQILRLMVDLPTDDAKLREYAEQFAKRRKTSPRQPLGVD